jgi:predicted DNA-binding mobile mystery protein A
MSATSTARARRRRAGRRALDRRSDQLRKPQADWERPAKGWVAAIRDALGMPVEDFARRMGVAPTTARAVERSESLDRVQLNSLRRAAAALDCDLVYALVPRQSLQSMVEERARAKAVDMLGYVGHSLALEDQRVLPEVEREQLNDLAARLIDSPGLWRD